MDMDKRYLSVIKACVLSLLLVGVGGLSSCNSDDIKEDAMYTFTGETVASFCEKTPELSLFYKLMDECGETALLEVYGHFTCFAPTNDAINKYLAEKALSWDGLSSEQKQKIVYNSVIRNATKEILVDEFEEGALSEPTLSDRYLLISFGKEGEERRIYVNEKSTLISGDHEVHNGVVHIVDEVIEPSEKTLLETLRAHGGFELWAEAYEASGWADEMTELYDEDYVNSFNTDKYQIIGLVLAVPEKLKLGYTMFCETDELLKANGITDLPSMENYARTYYGSEDLGNYKSKNNPLNRFIAYHMLNRQMATNSFLYTGETTNPDYADERTEYYETMYTYRLIKIKAGNRLNAKNSDNTSLRVIEKESTVDAINGFIHTLDGILVYDEEVMEKDVLHERIRFDFFACIPHLTNNNIRWKCYGSTRPEGTNGYTVTPEFCGEYFTYNDAGVCVFQADDAWADFQGDELVMQESYDFTLRMIPLPPGDYEMRIGYNSGGTRGMGQMYVDGNIAGTPVDLRINGDDPRVGWVKDSETNDDGVENDKMMRNRGYMKAPEALWYWHGGWDNVPMRDVSFALRYIVGQFHFEEYGAHTFRARSVDFKGRGFQLDYIEFIPTDMIRDEGRD